MTVWGFDDAGPAFGTFVSADRMWPDRVPCLRQLKLPKPPASMRFLAGLEVAK